MFDVNKVKFWYEHKLWTEKMVRAAVVKGKLTVDDYKAITGNDYE